MGSVEKAARQLFASQKADGRIPKGHPQRELKRKQQTYEQDFNATVLNLFDNCPVSNSTLRQACPVGKQAPGHDARH